jgi:hypothetical protein
MRYRTGIIYNQKHAYWCDFSPNLDLIELDCKLPHLPLVRPDSALHISSVCKHTKMRNMIIKRHNMASVLIVQTLQKGPCGANRITDIGSADQLSEQGLDLRNSANKTLPSWLLPNLANSICVKRFFPT